MKFLFMEGHNKYNPPVYFLKMNVMKVNFYVLSVFAVILMFAACEKNDGEKTPYDLSFGRTKYDMTTRGKSVPIMSGNGDYEIISSDENTITVTYDPFGGSDFGSIYVKPKKTGKADITVTDKLTGQSVKLSIRIHNAYLSFSVLGMGAEAIINDTEHKVAIENDLKNKFSFSDNEIYILVDNSSSTLYKFSSSEKIAKGEYINVGNYSLEEESGQYFLSFEFTDHVNKYIVDSKAFIPFFPFFDVKVDNETRLNSPPMKKYPLFEYFTDEYKPEYPDLVSARIAYIFSIDYPWEVDVPVKLLLEEQ